jgi:hypothetical protein
MKLKELKKLTNFVERNNVAALDVLVRWFNTQMVLNECVDRDKIINDGHHDLKLLDAISNWHELGCTGWKILPCYTTQVIFTQK